jgi:hypothetical protein
MVSYSIKYPIDENSYIGLQLWAEDSYVIRMIKVTRRKYWFKKVEELEYVRYNKRMDNNEIISHHKGIAYRKAKELRDNA